ncbi:MAG TPA: hypothetical protein VMB84_11430 [Stellaceae bacterium]|nr:hypothetical protein [Stellaceae bacterium]
MMRTKWLRLAVRDPGDILRWAGEQDARRLDDFRHRVIRGREFVSFRLVPRYPIEIGTSDIIVVAHVVDTRRRRAARAAASLCRHGLEAAGAILAAIPARPALAPAAAAALRPPAPARRSLP